MIRDSDPATNTPALPDGPTDPLAARTVLVVDDEDGVRDLLCRWLDSGGYCATPATDADRALELMGASPSAVAVCDIRMPGHDGLWLADRIRREHPDTAVIMATGVQDVGSAVASLRQGVVDYLTKPFGRDRLREAVWHGVEWHLAARDSRRWREALETDVRDRRARLHQTVAALRIDSDEALDAMLSILTISDRDAYAHAYRVAALSVSISRALGLREADVATVERGAMLHDIGKLAMPQALLRKPAPLTLEEQALIRLHPALGSELVEGVPYLSEAAGVVRDAHERMDGLGYPRGLRGDDVWIGARVVSVADAYDTMTRTRVFRDAITPSEAFLELDRCSDTQFDRRVVEALKRLLAVH